MGDAEVEQLKKELESTLAGIQEKQKAAGDSTLDKECGSMTNAPRLKITCKRVFKGHIHKVNAVHFAGDSRHCVSGALDGKLIIWDAWTGNKTQIIPLRSAWVMAVCFSPSGNFVASGGMDNMCTVHDLNDRDATGVAKITRELAGFEGFLSCAKFLDDTTLLTGSADMKIIVWDLSTGKKKSEYFGHNGDVVALSLAPDKNTFVTGSVDRSAKLWDFRTSGAAGCQQTFFGHKSDVNSICFHPSGYAFCTGSDDKTAHCFDIRSDQAAGVYKPNNATSGFTSCGISKSGRYVMCGSDDSSVHVWDLLTTRHTGTLGGHENRITSLSIPEDGMAVATASWDNNVRVYV